MTIEAQLADGRVLEFPDGTDPLVIQATVKRMLAPAAPKQSTIMSEAVRGGKQMLSSMQSGLGSILTPEESAIAGVKRGEQINAEAGEGPSFEPVKKAYNERGILPAAGEAISQIPRALAGQGANLAAMAGGARLGAMAGAGAGSIFPGVGTTIGGIAGGVLGAGAALLPQFMGSNVERQASEQMDQGKPVNIDRTKAYSAAAGQALLEGAENYFVLGKGLVKGVLGLKTVGKEAESELLKAAQRSVTGTAVRGVAKGIAVELPVEVGQQILERAQAGLDLTSPDALREYGDILYQTALIAGPIGGVANVAQRASAKAQITPPTPSVAEAPPAPVPPSKPPAPTYEALQTRLEVLQAQPNSKTRNRQLKAIREQMAAIPAQGELPETQVPQALEPEKDLRGKPVLPKATQPTEGLRDVIGAELPATTEVLQDAGIAPTQQELEAAGQQTMDLGETPTSTPITEADLAGLGGASASISKANREWLNTYVVGKLPEEVTTFAQQYPQLVPKNRFVKSVLNNLAAVNTPKEYANANPTQLEVQPTVRARGRKPSVGVPVQPAVDTTQAGGAAPTTGAPTEPVGQRLVSPQQPTSAGTAAEGPQPGALAEVTLPPAPQHPDEIFKTKAPASEAPAAPANTAGSQTAAPAAAAPVVAAPVVARAPKPLPKPPEVSEATRATATAEVPKVVETAAAEGETPEEKSKRELQLEADRQARSAALKAQREAQLDVTRDEAAKAVREAPDEPLKPEHTKAVDEIDAKLNLYDTSEEIVKAQRAAAYIDAVAKNSLTPMAVRQYAQHIVDSQLDPVDIAAGRKKAGEKGVLYSTENAEDRPLPEDVVGHIERGSVIQAMSALATTLEKGSIEREVAQRLSRLLGNTDIKIVSNLKGSKGQDVRGLATSNGDLIRLDSKRGMNVETFLHEGVHAASENVIQQDPKTWTPQQAAAVDELKALWEAAKRDKSIKLSGPATENLSEFITEAMTNKDLQVQLQAKPWKMKNAWDWFKRKMLTAIGVQHPKSMQDSVIAAMDTIFEAVPEYAHKYGPRSENFKKWFGNSEVVDQNGQPMVVYHGTLESFNTFRNAYADKGWEMFSESPEYAEKFAVGDGGNIVPVYLKIQNPLNLSAIPARRGDARAKLLRALEAARVDTTGLELPFERDLFQIVNMAGYQTDLVQRLQAAGIDGIKMPDAYGDLQATTYIAFSPNQIKSAIGNSGAYNATKPSMLEMVAPSVKSLVDGAGDLSGPERTMFTSFLNAFKAVPGVDYVTQFRTQTADIAATIEHRLRSQFDGKVRDSLGNFNPMGLYRQAQDYSKMMLQFLQTGSIEKEAATGLWKVVAKEETRAPAEVYNKLDAWSKKNGYSFEEGKKIASRILEGVRLDQMRKSNYTGATDFNLHKIDKNSSLSIDQQIDIMVAEYNAQPELREMSKLMDEARIALVDHMVEVGRLTPEVGKEWKEVVGYVPFDRMEQFAEKFSKVKRGGSRGLAQVGKLPELKGSFERPVGDVFGNYMNTLGWMMRQVIHTDATVRTLGALQSIGYATFFNTNPRSDHVVSAYVGGVLKYWELPSKYDEMAFKDLNKPQATWIQNLGAFSNVLRATVTALPPFALKQVTDDVQRAIMTSGVKSPAALLRMALTNFPKLAYAELRGIEHPLVKQFGAYGLSGEYDFQQNKPADSLLKDMGYTKRSTFGALMHKLEGITRASDLAVRAAIYEQTLKESNNDVLLAQTRSREFINFRRRGASEAIGAMVTTIPFFNAYVQGMDVLYRAASGKDASASNGRALARRMFWTRALTVTFISSLYALSKSDDDEYKDMDLRTRDSNWIFPNGYKLSVPGEIGAVFKVIPERAVEYMRRQGTVEEQSAFEVVASTLSYMYEQYLGRVNPIPQAIKPVLEAWSNKSFLTGRALEGFHHGQMDPSMRRTENTSELAIAIADFAKDTLKMEVSPIMIDNTLRGYFGSTAALVTATTDAMLNPDKVDRPLHKWALFSNYMYDPIGTRKVTEFYDQRDESMKATVTLKELMRTDLARAATYAETHMNELALESAVQSTLHQLQQTRAYRKFLNSAEGAKTMTRDERESQLEELKKMEVGLTSWVREAKTALRNQ